MKRTILFLVASIVMGVGAKAQQQTATLQRGISTTYYYGEDAFKEAYNAANDGSVITLSAGYFNTVDSVMKQITIRGNGYTGEKTVIGITESLGIPFSLVISADNVTLEGLFAEKGVCPHIDMENLTIKRCFLRSFSVYKTRSRLTNTIIDQCKVGYLLSKNNTVNLCMKNSYLDFFSTNNPNILFLNCVIGVYRSNCSYRNCIVNIQLDSHVPYDADQDYLNNVFICGVGSSSISTEENGYATEVSINESTRYSKPTIDAIENSNIKGNSVALFDDIFNYTTEENPLYAPIITTITGDDGTVVGPYGGTGFSENPSIPRITESKIDTYTDGEGKLNVKVKVEVGQ